MTQSTVGKGLRWLILCLLGTALAACDRPLDPGVYAFSVQAVELRTCEEASAPPESFEGELDVFGNELQIAFPVPGLHLAVGERTLIGRFFHGRDVDREFIADSSFRTFLRVGETDCPAFVQLGLNAITQGERAFNGSLHATYEMGLTAPLSCPVACAWALRFRAERIGDTMNDLSRSFP